MNTASTPHPAVVALPAKAVSTEDWQPNGDGRFYRFFEGETREIATESTHSPHNVGLFAHAAQYHDGAIDDGAIEPPGVSLHTGNEDGPRTDTGIVLSSSAARQLADVLVMAADEIDRWVAK
jgi:hypothetical protein